MVLVNNKNMHIEHRNLPVNRKPTENLLRKTFLHCTPVNTPLHSKFFSTALKKNSKSKEKIIKIKATERKFKIGKYASDWRYVMQPMLYQRLLRVR